MRYLFPILIAALLCFAGSPASAQRPDGDRDRGGRDSGDRDGRRGRGGFDPSSFLERLDRNSNGMLDPDEMEGPANFMIQRMQREDPSLKTDRPIPMSKVKEAFEKMRSSRGGRGGDRGDDRNGDRGRDSRDDDDDEDAMVVGVLVPGFGGVDLPPLVPGFGAAAELLAVRVTDEDLREAEEMLRRYDRNKDGFIGSDEISRRWDGNPMDFDQNRDNKLSPTELAVRTARRRINRADDRDNRDDRRRESRPTEESESEVEDRFGGRLSYRPPAGESPEGLPGWFADKDANEDGQVMMNEFAEVWDDGKVAEFFGYDINRDGVIVTEEVLRAVKEGPASGQPMASARSSTPDSSSADSSAATTPPASREGLNPKYVQYAERIISSSDADKNQVLTGDEWKTMLMDISPADADRDGRITVAEYAAWLQMRENQ